MERKQDVLMLQEDPGFSTSQPSPKGHTLPTPLLPTSVCLGHCRQQLLFAMQTLQRAWVG